MSDLGTSKEYNLRVKAKFVSKNIEDNGRTYHRQMVILIPHESDERTYFFKAWLPETREEYFELAGQLASPINSNVRLSIHLGMNDFNTGPYLFVMSKGVEELMIEHKLEGKTFNLKIFPDNLEDQADFATDSNGSYSVT